jgi:hypothetical protein
VCPVGEIECDECCTRRRYYAKIGVLGPRTGPLARRHAMQRARNILELKHNFDPIIGSAHIHGAQARAEAGIALRAKRTLAVAVIAASAHR